MVVDCHVHARDFEECRKETIQHALEVASFAGVDGIFAMPNTKPPIITKERAEEYKQIANREGINVFFGIYMGLTADVEQVKKAIEAARKLPDIVGFKLYAGKTTNPEISVSRKEDQYRIFEVLANEDFRGVVAVHAEQDDLMHPELFNSREPITHTIARPEEAETESMKSLLKIVEETGYKGKFDIKHISTPRGVELVDEARTKGIDVWCWVCPHHFIYDSEMLQGENGLIYKMNPPLRKVESSRKMFGYLKQGKIQGIETDHAPHTLKDKCPPTCASGIASLHAWPLFIEYLKQNDFSDARIEELTHNAALKRHGVEIPHRKRKMKYYPSAYDFNPWEKLERMLCH